VRTSNPTNHESTASVIQKRERRVTNNNNNNNNNQLTRVEIDAAHKRNVHTQTTMRTRAFQAHEGANGQRPFRSSRWWYNQGGPSRLTFGTIGTNLIFRSIHEHLEALFELFLIRHDDDKAAKKHSIDIMHSIKSPQ
jgi:hypothetical protein